jgi:hypothetical protein
MTNGLDVFGINEGLNFTLEEAKKTLEAKLNDSWIKQRQQGTATLSYIGGHTVIRLLNKAFNYQWSFEIVTEEVKQSVPKPMWDGWGKNRKPVLNQDGSQRMEPQPPVAKVLGRLTVPGVGVKEQYGSKVLIGGATEQESAFKSASTDALKKCASLFGIGLELYGDDEGFGEEPAQAAPTQVQPPQQKPAYQAPPAPKQEYQAPPAQPQTPPAKQETQGQAQTASAPAAGWQPDDINRLKDLKQILGMSNNEQLTPYVREFFDNPDVKWTHITPQNIKAFNIFLGKKAETI